MTKDVPDLALVAGVPARRIGWVGRAGVPARRIGWVGRAGVPARRIGWVGRADVRLEPAGDGMWRCSQTGELHRERDGVLTVV